MNRRTLVLLAAIFLWVGSCYLANAQATGDQISQGQQIIQDSSSSTGTFQAVTVDASSTSNVVLQFDISTASKPVSIEPLDGGTFTSGGGSSAIGTDGSLSFSFQVTDQPGVHRVVVIDPNADADSPHIIALVQLEVPSPSQ